jgi:chitinase
MKLLFLFLLLFCSFNTHSQQSLIGYFHNWNSQDVAWVHPQNVDSRYSVIAIAFAMPTSNTDMTMTFTPENMSASAFKQAIAQLKAQGKKVIISIGGATAYLDFPSDAIKNDFINSMNSIMDYYEFDGIDIDIEHGNCILITGGSITNPANASQVRLIDAIKSIMNHHRSSKGKKMMLTMAPETAYVQGGQSGFGSIWGGYLPMIHALRDSIDVLQVQLYNSGTMFGIDRNVYSQGTADFIVAMTEAVIQGFPTGGGQFIGLPASKVAVGLPACNQAAGGGYVDTAIISQAMKYLLGKGNKPGTYSLVSSGGYPTLKGMMTWSINWDAKAQCNGEYSFAGTYDRLFGNTPQPPAQVTMISPQYGQKITTDTVSFRWNKVSNAVYHIEIVKGGTIIKSDSTLSDTTFKISNVEYSQLHTWRVRAKNAQGWGQWNSPWTFTSRDLPIPSQVIALAPENFSKVNKDSLIIFKWKSAQSKISSYVFTLKKGNDLVHKKSDIKDTLYSYALPEHDATYSWNVQAVNSSGSGFPSDQRSIITNPKPLDPPGLVTLLEPNTQEITSDSILFRWTKANPMVLRYHLQVQLDDELLMNDSMLIDTSFIVAMPEQSGNLRWKVRAYNASGYGAWCISDSIRYSRLPPTPLATQFLNLTDSINISTDTVTISWKEVEHAETYELQVLSADSQFNHDTILAEKSHMLSNLKDGYQYSLQVRSINKRGKSPWSSPLLIKVAFPISSVSNENGKPIFSIEQGVLRIHQQYSLNTLPVQIYTIQGNRIQELQFDSGEIQIPVNDYSSGLYFLRIGQSFHPFLIQ